MNGAAPVQPTIDLNADMGEGFGAWKLGDDEALLAIVSSANVACGYHAGDASTMRRVCAGAAERGVAVGAQVSYRDLAGFGRRFIDIAADELTNDVLYQISALDGIARAEGSRVAYVKPHGALYNAIVSHESQARAVATAVRDFRPGLTVYGLPHSIWLQTAKASGLRTVDEAFADRAYRRDGTLVSRQRPDAVLHDATVIADRVVRLATQGTVAADDGTIIRVHPESICIHGDTSDATVIARAVRAALTEAGVEIRAVEI